MADTDSFVLPVAHRGGFVRRHRAWFALGAGVVAFSLIPLGVLPLLFAFPVIGLLLAWGARPDHVPDARPAAGGRRNTVIATLVVLAVAVVVLQPQLARLVLVAFGVEGAGLVVGLVAVIALALPLAMAESGIRIEDLPRNRVVLTQRNLILALSVMVTVATSYALVGLSFIPIGVLVIGIPMILALSRLVAARRGRLELGLFRHPLRAGLGLHRAQLLNVAVLAVLLAATLSTGAYDATALGLSAGAHRVFVAAFLAALVVALLLAAVPLRHVRLGSNVLVLAGSLFVAAQLVMIYRPASEPVTIASPLAEQWWVSQGGHGELVNYHYVTSTQRDALDIEQLVDGSTHRPGDSDLSGYYIYDQPVLAPADGVVTWVLDGRPDLPIGQADNRYQAGNNLVIDLGGQRYLAMEHLRQNSIQVEVGDRVKVAQPIARVGNSGNTTEPHIHIQAQTVPTGTGDVRALDIADTFDRLHTYPLVFRDVVLTRSGAESRPAAADVRRGDLVRPIP